MKPHRAGQVSVRWAFGLLGSVIHEEISEALVFDAVASLPLICKIDYGFN